jgi:hypothetical protein
MGTLANEKTDAVSIAKNQWVSDHMATENATRRAAGAKLLTRDEAEADYVGHFAKSHPPAIGPSRSGAQSAAEANEMVEKYAQGLRASGVQEIDVIPKTKAFIKNGFRP